MQLNHVHLGARDVAATQAFYENYCGFVKRADHGAGVFLDGDAGFLIAIDPVDPPHEFPSWYHLGFCQNTPDTVRELYARMSADGVRFTRELTEYDGEATVFYCLDPDGTKIEVIWHADG